jgi:hypothetical protein
MGVLRDHPSPSFPHAIFDSLLAFKVSLDSLQQNRDASLPALDDEYRLVVNDIVFTDLL